MKRPKLNAITAISISGFILAILLVAADEIFDIPYHLFNAPPTPINWTEIRIESIFILIVGSLTISSLWRLNTIFLKGFKIAKTGLFKQILHFWY